MSNKRQKTVEQTYQKKTQLEHILLRPDSYVGSIEFNTSDMWVFDEKSERMIFKSISIVPGLYKIFDEILVNAADNKQRDDSMTELKVVINKEEGSISVYNNGQGIPVIKHQKEQCYIPELIFGHLLTSSNYDDSEKKTTGGRNGYGAKLTNIFSTEFIVETLDSKRNIQYKQVFSNNMTCKKKPSIKKSKKTKDWTKITFKPDFLKFGMEGFDDDIVSLMKRRVYDIAGVSKGLKVSLNGSRLNIKSFKDYVKMYVSDEVIFETVNDRWEIAVSYTDGGFNQNSFVNSICTTKGGTHIKYITDNIIKNLQTSLKKKNKNMEIKSFHIKNYLWVFVNCLIENPAFDSQTKDSLTTSKIAFGSECQLSAKFHKNLLKTPLTKNILKFSQFKQNKELKKNDGRKQNRILGIPKLDDANNAGGRKSHLCTLILTEGDSAKTLAVSGLGVIGRDNYGVFPLRGKLLNVRTASIKQITNNSEITYLKKILGLKQDKVYTDIKSLRYGSVMIMTDQDPDGSHIKGLVINFFETFWPSLLKIKGFIKEFITPIIKCKKRNEIKTFYTLPEYETWSEGKTGWSTKYYKGLGTSTSKEAKEYFSDLKRHQISFVRNGKEDNKDIDMVFNDNACVRKKWLQGFDKDTFLDMNINTLSYSDFINKELILFSQESNIRAIPSVVDGLKPGQRKILYSCFKKNLQHETKVAQLSGYVSEHSAYHHGEVSLQGAIVKMAQDYVGSNNINLLLPKGQFGTRLQGGKDCASSRYIFTTLNPITRKIYHCDDDPILDYLNDNGQSIEPKCFVPIIPMVLVNGSSGIGTGWSSYIPNFNPIDIIENIKKMLRDEEPVPMFPWYKGFKGTIKEIKKNVFKSTGIINKVNNNTLIITELPLNKWTCSHKVFLESLLESGFINSFKENHTDTTVHFTIDISEKNMVVAENKGLDNFFKLNSSISLSNMVLFNKNNILQKYSSAIEILKVFYSIRLELYSIRKKYIMSKLTNELKILHNKTRFITEIIDGKLNFNNLKKKDVISLLVEKKYDTFNESFEYLLTMSLWSLTQEKVEQVSNEFERKKEYLIIITETSIKQMWLKDLLELQTKKRKRN
jgi:DNA topoisomerase-2